MIHKEAFLLSGRIRKRSGFKGELLLSLFVTLPEDGSIIRFLWIDLDGGIVPFHIENIEVQDAKTLRVKFTDILSETQALTLVDHDVYIEKALMQHNTVQPEVAPLLEGYSVSDVNRGYLGTVDSVVEQTHQDLLKIRAGEEEILIPMVPQLVTEINHDRKEILVDLPEGLLSLNA